MRTLPPDAQQCYRDCADKAAHYLTLPFGKPGRLLRKSIHGEKHLYREVSVLADDVRLKKLGPLGSPVTEAADAVFQASEWMPAAVHHLRDHGYYASARQLEEPLINAFNLGLFAAGAVLIGPLAFLYWLNELGVPAPAYMPAAPDLDLALPEQAALSDAQARFLQRCIKTANTRLHVHVDTADYHSYLQARLQLPYAALMKRHCFMINLHYLTRDAQPALALVGDFAVPISLPAPGRVYWQKLYWSRLPDNPRAERERQEAELLAAAIRQHDPEALATAQAALPTQWARQLGVLRDTEADAASADVLA